MGRSARGRPSRELAADIDKRVIEAAARCFLTHGYAGTTMQMIAGEAGVTKPTLYQRYADKEALLSTVVHRRVEAWSRDAIDRKVERGKTLDERLRYYGRSMLYWSQQPDIKAFGKLIRECQGSAPNVAREIDAIRLSRMLDQIASDIVEYGADEGLVAREPHRIAAIFYAMISMPPDTSNNRPMDANEAANHVDLVVDIMMRGASAWTR